MDLLALAVAFTYQLRVYIKTEVGNYNKYLKNRPKLINYCTVNIS